MILDELYESPQTCPECGGPAFSDLLLAEKKDACYHKVRSRYKVWPSAYASGALVQCRKKGAANWGNKSEDVEEAAGLYGPFTATINTGERPQSRTKTKKFKREDDAILWAQDWLEDFPQYPFATAEVTDPDGNVVWTTDEEDSPWAPAKQGVAEGISIIDQDSDLDQQVFTLNVDGNKVSFTYWDYETNFQHPDIKDIYQQAKEQLSKKLSPEQIKDVARTVFKSFEQGVAEGLNEFAPPGSGDDDGFSEETLKQLAAQWWNGDEDPRVERTLMAAGWEIGRDEGYDRGGVFVVRAGDDQGNSYISWPAEELEQGVAEDQLDEKCWDTHRQVGMKKKGDRMVPNCVPKEDVTEGDKVGNMDADKFDAAMTRLKQLAGQGPRKTVWDPVKRVYKTVPVNPQPK